MAIAPSGTSTASRLPDAAQHDEQGLRDHEQLQAAFSALQSEERALQLEQERLTNQLQSHQAQGQRRLAELKAQWSTFDSNAESKRGDPSARERFAERARVEMESALMMDQEYSAHLDETTSKLRQTQEKMQALRREQASIDASQASSE